MRHEERVPFLGAAHAALTVTSTRSKFTHMQLRCVEDPFQHSVAAVCQLCSCHLKATVQHCVGGPTVQAKKKKVT